jgi:hypothetical protein
MPVDDQALLDLMRREVVRQSRYALIAAEGIEYWLLHYDPDEIDPQEAKDRLWSSVQSFLGAAAIVSKLLWGTGESPIRKSLREALAVDDGSPLRDRELRNTFEHFDERLEALARNMPEPPLIDTYVGHFMGFSMRDRRSLLRGLDPETLSAEYQGKRYQLRPMISELRRLTEFGDDGE